MFRYVLEVWRFPLKEHILPYKILQAYVAEGTGVLADDVTATVKVV